MIRCVNHPDIGTLAEALTTFVASGTTPTSSQVYQLKISLKRMRKPIWRRVLVSAIASLGERHQVIQIVMNWDGDHLHAFSVGNERSGDPFYSPDLRDEESLRLSGAFTPSTKTITYLYDFGASWYHDITFERVLDFDVGASYPVCVTGRGDSPSSTGLMRTATSRLSPSTRTKSTAAWPMLRYKRDNQNPESHRATSQKAVVGMLPV